ncbi:ThuA domain-containing protein [Paenibacillus sp. YAF4_2]|uniref:ThuA domain-containing protein n=1 Tax=Paenibacillus sp. YAF4_2 TaxID=3233085 RepID=UPI003F9C6755
MRVGVICHDEWHPAEVVQQGFAKLANDQYEFDYIEHAKDWSEAWMNQCELIVLAKSNRVSTSDRTPWLTMEVQGCFQAFVEKGKGLFVIHAGTVGYLEEPLFRSLIGGGFRSHPAPDQVVLRPAAELEPFVVHDEHYQMEFESGDVFLTSESACGSYPAGWRRMQGLGRVAVLTPGHYADVWQHPSYQKLLKRELDWCAGERLNRS